MKSVVLFLLFYDITTVFAQEACSTDDNARLQGLSNPIADINPIAGRVEICRNSVWGTVCGDSRSTPWSEKNAQVVCKVLGFSGALNSILHDRLPPEAMIPEDADTPIHIGNVICLGHESSLDDCSFQEATACTHDQDVAITCRPFSDESGGVGDVRLIGDDQNGRGIVQLRDPVHGFIGICRDDGTFDAIEANIVCQQLGYGFGTVMDFENRDEYGPSFNTTTVTAQRFRCRSNDILLTSRTCDYTLMAECSSLNLVGIACATTDLPDGSIRLVGGSNSSERRVEILFNGRWGRICNDNIWSANRRNPEVACIQLGFGTNNVSSSGTDSFRGVRNRIQPIWLGQVDCLNNSGRLAGCPHLEPTGFANCYELFSTFVTLDCGSDSPGGLGPGAITAAVLLPVIFIILLATVCVLIVYLRRAQKNNKCDAHVKDISNGEDETNTLAIPNQGTPSLASAELMQSLQRDLIIPASQLHLKEMLGQGEFGIVYKAFFKRYIDSETELVAVKTLKGFFSARDAHGLVEEILKMQAFHHTHVMSLVGVCLDSGAGPAIVMPYMANGSLLDYLRKERGSLLLDEDAPRNKVSETQKFLLNVSMQIAEGMEYLAQEKIVHRDLAARNCMINADGLIKVADFGLSEDIYSSNYYRQGKEEEEMKLPLRWMALESILDGIYTEKTDVWSFGVTVWEVYSAGRLPYSGEVSGTLLRKIVSGERLSKPKNSACSDEVYSCMQQCWLEDTDRRPHFRDLATTISNMLESIAGYLDLKCSLSLIRKVKKDDSHSPCPEIHTLEDGEEEEEEQEGGEGAEAQGELEWERSRGGER